MERVKLPRMDRVREEQMKLERVNHLPEKEKRSSGQAAGGGAERKKKPFPVIRKADKGSYNYTINT